MQSAILVLVLMAVPFSQGMLRLHSARFLCFFPYNFDSGRHLNTEHLLAYQAVSMSIFSI